MAKKESLSYVELSDKGCDSIILRNLRIREDVYGGSRSPMLSDKDSKALAQTIIKLFESVAVKKKTLYRDYKEYKEMDYEMTMCYKGSVADLNYIVPTKFVVQFVEMYKAMASATHNTYNIGLDKGKNLLLGLNDGTYTIKDFNEKSKTDEE